MGYCHVNVREHVVRNGGQQQQGWLIFLWKETHLVAQYHSVWVSPQGEMLNITPHPGHEQVLFLPDDERDIEWYDTGMLLWCNVFLDLRTGQRWYDTEDGQHESQEHPRIRCLLLPSGECLMVNRRVKRDLKLPDLPTRFPTDNSKR